jgi:hypothetical protein
MRTTPLLIRLWKKRVSRGKATDLSKNGAPDANDSAVDPSMEKGVSHGNESLQLD